MLFCPVKRQSPSLHSAFPLLTLLKSGYQDGIVLKIRACGARGAVMSHTKISVGTFFDCFR